MSFAKLLVLWVLALVASSCGEGSPAAKSCPPADEPASFGRTCSADGECDGYLVCADTACGWPAAMTGERGDATAVVSIERGDTRLAKVPVELARGDLARRRGLGGRPCMQPGWGMLFEHPDEAPLAYTVEEMRFGVDLVFADADGVIVAVWSKLMAGSMGMVRSGEAAKYALEIEAGEVDGLGVRVGDRLVVE